MRLTRPLGLATRSVDIWLRAQEFNLHLSGYEPDRGNGLATRDVLVRSPGLGPGSAV